MKADIEWLKKEAHRNLYLVSAETGFEAPRLRDYELRRIAAEWHAWITEPMPSYALSSTGSIVNGIFDELARDLRNVREARWAWVSSGCVGPAPYEAVCEAELGALIIYCARRVTTGKIGPVKGWANLRW